MTVTVNICVVVMLDDPGVTVTVGVSLAEPDRLRVTGAFSAARAPEDEILRVPVRFPTCEGVNVTLNEQAGPLSGSGVAHASGATLKSPVVDAVMPVTPVPPKLSVFEVMVTVCEAEVLPTVSVAKAGRDAAGDTLICGVERVKSSVESPAMDAEIVSSPWRANVSGGYSVTRNE